MTGQQGEGPSPERRRLPETITAGGVTRLLTNHARGKGLEGISVAAITSVLENWTARGICQDNNGSITHTYWGFVPERNSMLRVAISLDDRRIVTAHYDRGAVRRLAADGRPWFWQRCRELEFRDAD